jgi:uncharacterized protein YehS (DUF1456 family)
MTNNEVMKSVRYTLEIKNKEVVRMIKSGGVELGIMDVVNLLKDDTEESYLECSAEIIHAFLDGLILKRRGPSEGPAKKHATSTINNNTILRKLRIAFEMRDTDMIKTLNDVGLRISKSEISALFRAPKHKHFMPCGDQFLRNFLKGLTRRYRKDPTTG